MRVSDPELDPWAPQPRRSAPSWLLGWWLTWTTASYLWLLPSVVLGWDEPASLTVAWFQTVTAALYLVAGLAWIRVLRTVQHDQEARAARYRRELPSWLWFAEPAQNRCAPGRRHATMTR